MRYIALVLAAFLASITAAAAGETPVVHHAVSSVPAAQAAFDRGLLDYYAYNPEAAEHEFYTAADLDPHLAMAWWGIALSNAPNLNVPPTDDRDDQARFAVRKAKRLETYASAEDAALIDAAAARFDGDSKAKLNDLQIAYRDALQRVAKQYPGDPDVATLYAEAALYVTFAPYPDSYGKLDAKQRAESEAAFAALLPYYQTELARFPKHVGLIHFYVHTAQLGGQSRVAVDAAKQLAAFAFADEDSHLTHMSGHTFFDVGMYDAALDVGERSVAMDDAAVACCHPGYYSAVRYYHNHNVSFLLYAMTQTGHLDESIAVATRANVPDFLAAQLVAAGRWQDVLAVPFSKTSSARLYYARALALAKLGQTAAAEQTIAGLPKERDASSYSRLVDKAMAQTVAGEIALAKNDDSAALAAFVAASGAMNDAQTIQAAEYPPLYSTRRTSHSRILRCS